MPGGQLPVLLHYLEQTDRYDWIFWSDADALFINYTTPLTAFVPTHPDVRLAPVARACGCSSQ